MGLLSKLFAKPVQPRVIVEERAWVMVYDVPAGDGWHRIDDERRGADFVVEVIKLVRTDDKLVLIAKDYAGSDIDTLAQLEARDWNGQYAQIFGTAPRVEVTKSEQTLMDRVVPALDVVAHGGDQRIRERYASVPGHQLIITAAGAASAHDKYARDIDRWFAGVAFRVR